MDKTQIGQIANTKALIKNEYEARIRRLKEEMESALSSLSLVEKTLVWDEANKLILPIKPMLIKRTGQLPLTVEERIMDALQQMDGEFSTGELREKASNDGNGEEIKKNSFYGIFTDLVMSKKIIVVREKKGNQGGLYKRSGQGETQSESFPAMR